MTASPLTFTLIEGLKTHSSPSLPSIDPESATVGAAGRPPLVAILAQKTSVLPSASVSELRASQTWPLR